MCVGDKCDYAACHTLQSYSIC